VSVKDAIDAIVAQASALRAELLEERQALLVRIGQIDEDLARLPGAEQHPRPTSLEEYRHRRKQLHAADVGRKGIPIASRDILHAAGLFFGFTVVQLKGRDRYTTVTRARHVAIYLSRKLTDESFPEIGAAFGERDHTTIIAAARKIEDAIAEDAELRAQVETLESVIHEAQASRVAAIPGGPT
jgi:hypothetical protein